MDAPPTEFRRTRLTTGSYGPNDTKTRQLASAHPFTQQESALESALQGAESEYWTCGSSLSTFLEYANSFVSRSTMESTIIALGMPRSDSEDVWCLDTHGILSLSVTKVTYERLGLVGQKLPWKGSDDTFIIHVSLHEEVPQDIKATRKWHRFGGKQKDTLRAWDARRGPWKILYNYQDTGQIATGFDGSAARAVKPSVHKASDIYVPDVRLLPRSREDAPEDWDDDISSLFEWVGMACLGAQRLQANDRADPYLAVYTPPSMSHVGSITHMRWMGLLPPAFVQSIMDITINWADHSGLDVNARASIPSPFVAFTGHGVPNTPVAYLPLRDPMNMPLRAPRPEAEDTWSLIISNGPEPGPNAIANIEWVLAESIGRWDARWG